MSDSTVSGLVLRSARRTPHTPAVVSGRGTVTYLELVSAAWQVCSALRTLGVDHATLVGIASERDERYLAGALGAMLAGCCFVPLDPSHPRDRLRGMVDRAGIGVVVAGEAAAPVFRELVATVVPAEASAPTVSLAAVCDAATPEGLAYGLFTSGSTGRPKLVGIEHRSICALLDGFDAVAPPRTRVVSSTVSPFSFDASIWETFSALTRGGTVHILPNKIAADPQALAGELVTRDITTAYLPPVGLEFLIDELRRAGGVPRLERIMVGAEPIPLGTLDRLQRLAPHLVIVNAYGPTEATVCSTFHVFRQAADPDQRTPIGTPVRGWLVRVVDGELADVPAGEIGEIVVGGQGLARGYLGDAELTAERFVHGSGGRRWYRTGDLGRWLPSGDLEFVGRRDDQVKIRGFRIELGEIEAALGGCAGVRGAVALPWPGPAGLRLIAFAEGTGDGGELRRWLAEVLPDYMVPARVVVVDRFPLTPNAKVDRRALLELASTVHTRRVVAPASDVQRRVAQLWTDVLGIEQIGIHDNFFDLGGDSRLAMVLVGRVLRDFGEVARPTELLRCHTLAELAARLDGAPARRADDAVEPAPAGPAPLSFGQEGLWRFQRLNPANHAFAIPIVLRVRACGAQRLRDALLDVLSHHEAFSLEFGADESGPWQRVSPHPAEVEICPVAEDPPLMAAYDRMAAEVSSLEGRPWRAQIHPGSGDEHVVLLVCHHVIIDGHSVPLIVNDLADALGGRRSEARRHGPVAFAGAQRERAGDADWERDVAYWREALNPMPGALELPHDRPRPVRRSGSGRGFEHDLGDRVAALARRLSTTPFVVVLAAAGCLAHRYSGQRDFVISIPAAVDRLRPEYAGTVGYFVNVVPVRFGVDSGDNFADVLAATARRLDDAIAHGALPFEAMIPGEGADRLDNARALTRFMVAQHIRTDGDPTTVAEQAFEPGTAKYELSLFVDHRPDGTRLRWEYDDELFDPPTIATLSEALDRFIREVAENPDRPVGGVGLLTDRDRAIIAEANRTATPYPDDASLLNLFDEQVRRRPDAVALETGSATMTYGDLSAAASRLAAALGPHVTADEEPVIVFAGRCMDFVVAVLAVLRAGGSYVPVDSRNPADRLRTLCALVGARVAIAPAGNAALLPAGVTVLDPSASRASKDVAVPRSPDSRAYVMFTSGSTGTPKGVEITDRSIVRLVRGQTCWNFGADDAFALASNLAFDAATFEIWGALLNGGRLIIPDDATVYDPRELAGVIGRHGVTAGFFNPAVFRSMLEADQESLRGMHTIVIGGEAVPGSLMVRAAEFLDHRVLVNGYGPTENTTFSCCHRLTDPLEPGRAVPIGRPIANSSATVVDGNLAEVPVGVVGEIVVGGAGLARGYLGDAELTAERFVCGSDGRRWYRTGDLGRWLPSGDLEFVGRRDDQVKIRGFRIELGEIEAALGGCAGVRGAVALPWPGPAGLRLIAFAEGTGDGGELRRRLAEVLPDYMVPARVVVVDRFPLTPNAKVDRRALLDLASTVHTRRVVAPTSDVQRRVAQLWTDVLGIEQIGIHDNFFDLGGDSRTLVLLTERIRRAFDDELRVVDVMGHPSIADLSRLLDTQGGSSALATRVSRRAQSRRGRR